MTDRERWTIYPLLFLSLGASLKDKLLPPLEVDVPRVKCQQLVVVDAANQPRIELAAPPVNGGQLTVYSAGGKPVVGLGADSTGTAGTLQLISDAGKPLVVIDAATVGNRLIGGRIVTCNANGEPRLFAGTEIDNAGLLHTLDPAGAMRYLLFVSLEQAPNPNSVTQQPLVPWGTARVRMRVPAKAQGAQAAGADQTPPDESPAHENAGAAAAEQPTDGKDSAPAEQPAADRPATEQSAAEQPPAEGQDAPAIPDGAAAPRP